MYYLEIIILGFALGMDALSLSISISLIKNMSIYKILIYAVVVGLYHFFMPILGYLLKLQIESLLIIPPKILFIIVLIFILIGVIIDKDNKITDKLLNPFIFGFSVSIDSFTVGITLEKSIMIISSLIFFLISSCMTFLGLLLGFKIRNKYQSKCKIITICILALFLVIKLIN